MMNATLILVFGLVQGFLITALVCISLYLNLRFRNLRNAVIEFTEHVRRQEMRYDILANRFARMITRINAIQSVPFDPAEHNVPSAAIVPLDDSINAWQRILHEDEWVG